MSDALAASRLLPADILRVGASGLRSRRLRAALSALGVAIGIASMVAVLGVSESSKADLLAALDRLGTNLLEVSPGQTFTGDAAELPESAPGMVRHMQTVEQASAIKALSATVRRTDRIDEAETGGITVTAADTDLDRTLGATLLEHIERLREERGVTILLVEHDMDVVMRYSDMVVVMGEGRVLTTGRPEEVRADPRVIEAYLGAEAVEEASADG